MKLSIIIPTYNSDKTIKRALDSIVRQTFIDYEVLIMDGLSRDCTLSLCASYGDPRIKVFSEKDEGIYDAMNKGIGKAQGDWLYFLGSDDYLFDKTTLSQVFSFERPDVQVMYGDVESAYWEQRHAGEWSIETMQWNRCHQGIFYHESLFKAIGIYNTNYPVLADFDLNLRWFLSKKIKSLYVPVVVAHFSEGGISTSDLTIKDSAFSRDFKWLILRYGFRKFNWEQRKSYLIAALGSYGWFKVIFDTYLSLSRSLNFWKKRKTNL